MNYSRNNKWLWVVVGVLALFILIASSFRLSGKSVETIPEPTKEVPAAPIVPIVTVSATPTPEKPKPLSFAEMNKLYGPCVSLPVLMYHHVEPKENAKLYKRTGLNVPPEMFKKQMEYLKAKGYTSITPLDLINFFDNGTRLSDKPVLITFDDGYVDNGDLAFPIMRELGMKGIVYLPTGLMENFDYLTWAKVDEMKSSGLFTFGNHTWSHTNTAKSHEVVTREITTADTQLKDRGLNEVKTFAYPYGIDTTFAEKLLTELNYKLAFTTVNGKMMCKAQRLSLPRIRIGNTALSAFGL